MMDREPQIMARAIFFTSMVVVLSIVGVLLHLWLRRPPNSAGGVDQPRRQPVLVNEPDGSVYDLNLKLDTLEKRLEQEEGRSRKSMEEAATLEKERTRLERQVRDLTAEVNKLRREITRRPPAETPPDTTPETPTPVTPPPVTPPVTPEGPR